MDNTTTNVQGREVNEKEVVIMRNITSEEWLLSPIEEDFTQLHQLGFSVEKDAVVGTYVASRKKINVTGKSDELMYQIILSYQALVMYYELKPEGIIAEGLIDHGDELPRD